MAKLLDLPFLHGTGLQKRVTLSAKRELKLLSNECISSIRVCGLFSRILVPVDGSNQSMAAAHKAVQIAQLNKSEILVLHVVQFPAEGHYVPSLFNKIIEERSKDAERWFREIREEARDKGIRVSTKITECIGSPVSAIVRQAKNADTDLILMGTRGRTKLTRMLIGSTALGVVTHAPCSVMIVRRR